MTMPTDEPDGDISDLLQIGLILTIDLQAATCTVEIDGEEFAMIQEDGTRIAYDLETKKLTATLRS